MFKKLSRKYFVSLRLHSCSDENDKEQIFHSEDNRLLINNVDSHLKAPYILDDTNNIVYDITIDSKYSKAEMPDDYFIKFNIENDDSKRIS